MDFRVYMEFVKSPVKSCGVPLTLYKINLASGFQFSHICTNWIVINSDIPFLQINSIFYSCMLFMYPRCQEMQYSHRNAGSFFLNISVYVQFFLSS